MTREVKKILDDMPQLLKREQVWHVGTTIPAQKKPNSHAGRALAVSLHPQSWRQIAALEGPLFRLEKSGGVFADVYACLRLPGLMQKVWTWAQGEQYVRWQSLYHVKYCDSEAERWRILPFMDEGQALAEYQGFREDELEARYETLLGYAPTERMRQDMMHTMSPLAFVQDFALFLFLENCFPLLDGVWWEDEHRPDLLSAPHGAIFQRQLFSWKKICEEG